MTTVGLLGILLALLAFPFSAVHRTPSRVIIFFAALLLHTLTAVIYYYYAMSTSADSALYYYDPYEMVRHPVKFGTLFVVHLVQTLKGSIGGTYLDYFFMFHVLGFWGIVFLMRTVEEIYLEMELEQPKISYVMMFLPGIFFWTSAIGKDAPLFLACSMAVWAAMQLRRRFLMFALAVCIMVLFRPHVGLVALVALAGAAFFDPRSRGYTKVALLMLAVGGAGLVAGSVQSSLNVDVASAESIGEFFARQSEVSRNVAGTTAVAQASFPVKLFSLLCRPFFVDAEGLFGIIASVENVLIMAMIITILVRGRETLTLIRSVMFLRFSLIFAVLLTVLLAMIYYNVGLGLRQKMMIMPGIISLYAAVLATRMMRSRAPGALAYAGSHG